MAPRKRKQENVGLPSRWRYYHGAYRYQVPPGAEHLWGGQKQFTLGKTLAEAYRIFAEHVESARGPLSTMEQILDRYAIEVVPTKAPKTRASNYAAIKRLRPFLGPSHPTAIVPRVVYQYVDRRKAKVAAHRVAPRRVLQPPGRDRRRVPAQGLEGVHRGQAANAQVAGQQRR